MLLMKLASTTIQPTKAWKLTCSASKKCCSVRCITYGPAVCTPRQPSSSSSSSSS